MLYHVYQIKLFGKEEGNIIEHKLFGNTRSFDHGIKIFIYRVLCCVRETEQSFCFCLFVWGLSSHSRIFHSCGDVIITGEGCKL